MHEELIESSSIMKNMKPSKFPPILEWLNCAITIKGNIIQPLNLGHRRLYGNFGHICDLILILNGILKICAIWIKLNNMSG